MGIGQRAPCGQEADTAYDPYAQVPAKPRGKRFAFRYGLFRALLLVALITLPAVLDPIAREAALRPRGAFASAGTPNRLPAQAERHQVVPPSPSGANPPYPLNHTLDADPVALGGPSNADFETAGYGVGTAPTNSAFDTADYTVGSQPTNNDFGTGDFTGWTTGGSGVSVQTSGGPDNQWARLNGSNGAITSAAFTVDSAAQVALFDLGWLTTSGVASVTVSALSGTGYATSTTLRTLTCTACNSWATQAAPLQAFLGQSIKLKFVRANGTIGVDRVRQAVVADGYAATSTVNRVLDGSNPYLKLVDGNLTSAAFTVDASAQLLTLRLTGLTGGSDQAYVDVLAGSGYTSPTNVLAADFDDAWATYRINLASWSGQSIELRVRQFTGTVGVDDVGLQRVDLPGWTLGGVSRLVAGEGGGSAAYGGTITSSAVTLPSDVQQLAIR